MDLYKKMIIETYVHSGGGSSSSVRARAIKGQGVPTSINVECSKKMRNDHPIGTKFELDVKLTDREGGTPFLYAKPKAPYTVAD